MDWIISKQHPSTNFYHPIFHPTSILKPYILHPHPQTLPFPLPQSLPDWKQSHPINFIRSINIISKFASHPNCIMFPSLQTHPQSQLLDESLAQFQTNAHICKQYIKLASERLYLSEASCISEANVLLEKLSLRDKERVKDLSEWDVFTTRDSLLPEDLSLSINLANVTERGGRTLTRRSNQANTSRTSRDFQGSLSEALAEVEQFCSPRGSNVLRKLLEDFRRLKSRSIQYEKKEKAGRHLQKLIEQLQERNVMLGQRLEEAQGEIERLRNENGQLKGENKELEEVLFQKMNEVNSERKLRLFEEIVSHRGIGTVEGGSPYGLSFELVTQVISEKESILNMRLQAVQQVEARVQDALFGEEHWEGACRDCCGMLRRLKDSVLTYRTCLAEQARLFEAMFDSFRQRLQQQSEE